MIQKLSTLFTILKQNMLRLKPIYIFFRELGVFITVITVFGYLFYQEGSQYLFHTLRANYYQSTQKYSHALSDYRRASSFAETSGNISNIISAYKKILNVYEVTNLDMSSFAYKYLIGRLYEYSDDKLNASIYYKQLNGQSAELLRKVEVNSDVLIQDEYTEFVEYISETELSKLYTEIAYFFEQQADCSFMEKTADELNKTLIALEMNDYLLAVERKGSTRMLLANYGECSMTRTVLENAERVLPKLFDRDSNILAFKENKLVSDYTYYAQLANTHKKYYLYSTILYEKALEHDPFNQFSREQINSINTKISIIVDRIRFYFLTLIKIVENKRK